MPLHIFNRTFLEIQQKSCTIDISYYYLSLIIFLLSDWLITPPLPLLGALATFYM
jgi:hypothetical protein